MKLSIPPERASAIKVWLLIPTRQIACLSPHHINLSYTLQQHGIWHSIKTLPGDSLVTRSRNNLADIFLSESTDDDNHFSLWLDDDIIFEPEAVLQMLSLNLDFVAAPYTRKGLHMDRMAAATKLGWKSADIASAAGTPNVNFLINNLRLDVPVPVLEAGSGFWLVKRKVFQMMADNLPIRYTRVHEEQAQWGRQHAHDFFRVGIWPDGNQYISEDWWFCREWRKLGGTVWCAFWIKSQHIGPYQYPMDMDMVMGLLNQTHGYIHGPTWGKEHSNEATPHSRREGTAQPQNASPLGEEAGSSVSRAAD